MKSFELSPFVVRPQQDRSRIALARIIAGACEVLIRNGNNSFSMADIADAARLPVGSIYRRFKGKDSIAQAISLDTFTRLADIVRERMQGHHFASASEVVAELAAGMAMMSEQNEPLVRFMVGYSTITSAEYRDTVLTARQRLIEYYADAISGFLQHLPEQRRDIVIGFSFQIVSSAIISKIRGDYPSLIDFSWAQLVQEATDAATSYLEKAA